MCSYARDFADRRKIRAEGKTAEQVAAGRKPGEKFIEGVKFDPTAEVKQSLVNRLYAVETMPTNTGGVADHRLGLTKLANHRIRAPLAKELGVPGVEAAGTWDDSRAKFVRRRWLTT